MSSSRKPAAPSGQRTKLLDWDGARARLAALASGERGLSAAQVAETLQARAAALAGTHASGAAPLALLELIGFQLGTQRCAIETAYVCEVRRSCELTRLPGAAAHLLGVTNLRGEILPLFELRDLLGLGRAASDEHAHYLVLGAPQPELCIQVDAVHEIFSIEEAALLPAPEAMLETTLAYRRGVTHDARVVLDASAILSDPQLLGGEADELPQRTGAS